MIFDKLFKKDKDPVTEKSAGQPAKVDYYAEGVAQFNAGHYTQAMEYFQAAVAENPQNESAHLKLAESFRALGKTKEAESILYKLLAINPSSQSAHKLLADIRQSIEKKIAEEQRKAAKIQSALDQITVTVEKHSETTQSSIPPDIPYDPHLDLADFKMPDTAILEDWEKSNIQVTAEELADNKDRIVQVLHDYGVEISEISAIVGPTITFFKIKPVPGVRFSKIKNLEEDIAISLGSFGVRIIAPIPGESNVGIEVPHLKPQFVSMKTMLESEAYKNAKMELPLAMGKTITNECFITDLTKMPHLLIAGTTGSGKSVALHAMIASLLYAKHPSELKLVLIDTKRVEFSLYSSLERHYLAKMPDKNDAVITDLKSVVQTLNALCIEMDTRFDLLKLGQVRGIKDYNDKFCNRMLPPEHGHRYLPYIVVIIDEFDDLMMTVGKEVEIPIARLAQLARAVGIHLIIATQRPTSNIITGTIKANFSARMAFRLPSGIDSRTILDIGGAQNLIGRGDLLLSLAGKDMMRLQCALIDTPEIDKLVHFIGNQRGYSYAYELPKYLNPDDEPSKEFDSTHKDEFFDDAARLVVASQFGSTSLLQRKLQLGYNRAGRIIDQLEAAGIVGPSNGSKPRDVLIHDEVALEQLLRRLK